MSKRDVRYEFIRVIAMLLVISAHSLFQIPSTGSVPEPVISILTTLFCLCNGLFFMLSGKFSLNSRCETPGDYLVWYEKRLITIGIPVLLFMLLRTMYNSGWWPAYLRSEDLWRDYLHNILSGFRSCDYWFLYPLTGILAAAPFLGKLLQRLSSKELLILLGLGLGFNALSVYLPALGLPFEWEFPLGGWFVLFLLGYALERVVTTRRAENAVMAAGAASFLLTITQLHLGFAPGANDLAPTYALTCAAVFLGLKRLYRSGTSWDRLFLTVGKHSLSVYLCHSMILSWVEKRITGLGFPATLVLQILATTLLSLALAFLLDHTVIALLQALLRKLLRCIPAKSEAH